MPASDVSAWAKASQKPDYNYSEVGARPDTWVPNYNEVMGDKPPVDAQKNEQSDWREGSNSSDAFIKK